MNVLITGGAGYIGSHACVGLMSAGHSVVIFDNFSGAKPSVPGRIERIAGWAPAVVTGDVRDEDSIVRALTAYRIEAVIHLAGLKSVAQSIVHPQSYEDINVGGTDVLIRAMVKAQVYRLVFASSAAVYGEPAALPIGEDHPVAPSNPYGRSKLSAERKLEDLSGRGGSFRIAILRFFNPVGAHQSGLIGDDPRSVSSNLMPRVSRVAAGHQPYVEIFGRDYETPDGTTVRDYLHIMDLVAAQIRALIRLDRHRWIRVNLGTGRGHSILELLTEFSEACQRTVPHVFAPRRAGDVAQCYASAERAFEQLGWRCERSLADMCRDTWRWQRNFDVASSIADRPPKYS